MLDSVFKFHRGLPDYGEPRGSWSHYYSCFLVAPNKNQKYLGCIFKDVGYSPEPFYVMTTDHHKPYIHYKTRGAAAVHLLFEDL